MSALCGLEQNRNKPMNLILEPKEYVADLIKQGYEPSVIAFYSKGIEYVDDKYRNEVERIALTLMDKAKYFTLTGIEREDNPENESEVIFSSFDKEAVIFEKEAESHRYKGLKITSEMKPIECPEFQIKEAFDGVYSIHTDLINDGDEIGYISNENCSKENLEKYGVEYRLLDDDGIVYFEGFLITDDSESLFAPLDNHGEAYGCTEIQVRNKDKKWESV